MTDVQLESALVAVALLVPLWWWAARGKKAKRAVFADGDTLARITYWPLPDDIAWSEIAECDVVARGLPDATTLFENVERGIGPSRYVGERRVMRLLIGKAILVVVANDDATYDVRRSPATAAHDARAAIDELQRSGLTQNIAWLD